MLRFSETIVLQICVYFYSINTGKLIFKKNIFHTNRLIKMTIGRKQTKSPKEIKHRLLYTNWKEKGS